MSVVKKYLNILLYFIQGPKFYGKGGGKTVSPPPPPSPGVTADAQLKLNKETSAFDARLNRYTQKSPTGQITWQNLGTDANPNWEQTTTLSDPQIDLYANQLDTQREMARRARNKGWENQALLSAPTLGVDPYALNKIKSISDQSPVPGGDLATRQHVEKGLFDRLNPQLQRDDEILRTRLANQGLAPGGEAYTNAIFDRERAKNDARLAIIGQGGQEMQLGQNLELAKRNQGLQEASSYADEYARNQQEQNLQRNQALAEFSALNSGAGNVSLPSYEGNTSIQGPQSPDLTALTSNQYNAQLGRANAQQAARSGTKNAGLGALGTLGGAAVSRYGR